MLISFNWLRDYVPLDLPPAELTRRLMLAGLNHESTQPAGADFAIDLEVTSNRPDCLGHLGIAREAAVLLDLPLTLPAAAPAETGPPIAAHAQLAVERPDLCPRYTARVIRGVQIKSSPAWLADRLQTLGVASVNNVVDVTNYVLLECGQPLHAFDLGRLAGGRIVVRQARPGDVLQAIDHKEYKLPPGACVIADGRQPVAIAGIMGGAATEVGPGTQDILLESAEFDPLVTRTTARALGLHSPSSYRFERGVDPAGVEWASRRACELILQLAGGALCSGLLAAGEPVGPRPAIVLRLSQLPRILGIEVPAERVRAILRALGLEEIAADSRQVEVIPPSWRRDLTREIDLVEEVARIHGYDAIPEDVRVPMAASVRTTEDRVLSRARHVLTASGFDEAYTLSVVEEELSAACSPWTAAAPLSTQTPVLGRATLLRRSLIPSLLAARRTNESLGNAECELFEIARGYLPQAGGLPREELLLAFVTDKGLPEPEAALRTAKGVVEAILGTLGLEEPLQTRPWAEPLFDSGATCELLLGTERIGVLGQVSTRGLKQFDLRKPCLIAELRLRTLFELARLVPKHRPLSNYPAIGRDINLVVEETVAWAELAQSARSAAGTSLETLECKQVYRDEKRLGAGKKSIVLGLSWRSPAGTLTNKEADALRDAVVALCKDRHGAELRA